MIDRRLLTNFDWFLLADALLIIAIGISAIYSATAADYQSFRMSLAFRQLLWLAISLPFLAIVLSLDYHTICRYAPVLYITMIVALVVLLFLGKTISGSRRWIQLGPMSIQPSEFSKLVMIAILARYFERVKKQELLKLRDLLIPGFLIAIPFFLIAKQPDLGTSIIIVLISFSIILLVGINKKSLVILFSAGLVSIPFLWSFLKDYQKKRVLTLFNPNSDPLGTGYHAIQSKIAVGSGELWGKGFLEGTQSRLNFLPEKHTDFIFATIAEETGFIGGMVILILFAFLIYKGISIAHQCKDRLGLFIAAGVTSMLTYHIVLNIGMAVGIAPIVGIPLPFISYGGSSLFTFLMATGLLLNVNMRNYKD